MSKDKKIEVAFITIFSVLIFAIFFTLISMNGVVLGNDPAVHLEKAQIFLNTGKISLENLGWTPPLYELVLAMMISLTGATSIGQLIFLVKVLAVVIDWLLFLSVYLIASRFFNRKVGAVAAVLLLMCFPMYEVNQFGGYTTVIALAFMLLVFLYTPLAVDRFGYLVVTFLAAFGVVLSHQLATFLAVFIMPPILIYMLIKSKGAYLKVVVALILGGGIAFFLYYFQAVFRYLDLVLEYVFFAVKTYAYQIPSASFNAFLVNFGFIFFLSLVGIYVSYHVLKPKKKLIFFLTLMLAFFVPLFFAESYLFGFYMPFSWFIYYLTPIMAILAAVPVVFLADKSTTYYSKNKLMFRKNWLKIATVTIIILLSVMVVYHSDVVYGKILEAGVYYATTDIKAQEAGVWLKANYPDFTTVVTTEIPGFWFQEFSGKNVTAQTDPTVQRNEIAESVLSLSYEIQHPQTLIRAYEAKGDIAEETFISIDQVWTSVSYTSQTGDFISYTLNGTDYKLNLSNLNKQIVFDEHSWPKKIEFIYSNDYVALTNTVLVGNNSYPVDVSWSLTPLKSDISNSSLYLSTFFDLKYSFDKAQIPQLLDWVNPWDAPEAIKTVDGTNWAVASFTNTTLKDNYIGLYDDTNNLAYAFKFNDLPDWGNIGALGNRRIDAVRFQYNFNDLSTNQTATRSYQVLSLSKSTYPSLKPETLQDLFSFKPAEFTVLARDFSDYIRDNNIGFIVYDRNHLDTQIIHSKRLQLIYSNDRYDIFKITN
ncbi:MAG TPA: glycosyltransferase family 39 protein [Candidatus Binatia bacterium]|nr:glycosyltransferase family 39 protein [Candidatus Binatia bacterium]